MLGILTLYIINGLGVATCLFVEKYMKNNGKGVSNLNIILLCLAAWPLVLIDIFSMKRVKYGF